MDIEEDSANGIDATGHATGGGSIISLLVKLDVGDISITSRNALSFAETNEIGVDVHDDSCLLKNMLV